MTTTDKKPTATKKTPVAKTTAAKTVTKKVTKKVAVPKVAVEAAATTPPATATPPAAPTAAVEAAAATPDVPIDPNAFVVINFDAEFKALLSAPIGDMKSFKASVNALSKRVGKEMKAYNKILVKQHGRKTSGNRKQSGITKPVPISGDLAVFLAKPAGTEMSRTEVAKEINDYVKSNGLQSKTNGRFFIPDDSLTKLLNYKSGDDIGYFNLQRYMKLAGLFPKVETAAVEASA